MKRKKRYLKKWTAENEFYFCMECNKPINIKAGITTKSGRWVCDSDSCRTLDSESEANDIIHHVESEV